MRMRAGKILIYGMLIILSVIFLFPLYWAFITAIKSPAELNHFPPTFFPKELHFENFVQAWNAQPFSRYALNSLTVTVLDVIGMVFSSALVAYGFARFEFKGKNIMFALLLSTMMIPWDVLVIPLYMQYHFFGWLNSLKPLTVPAYFGGAFYIFLMRQFLRSIPKDFEEAAVIDGANHFQIFAKIFIPLLKPQLVLSAVLYAIVVWNDYLGPLVYISDSNKFTLPIGLSLFKGAFTTDFTSIMDITVIMALPTIIMFFVAQKHILNNNITAGLKG